jgi:phosphoserine phosphatase RsbU/P
MITENRATETMVIDDDPVSLRVLTPRLEKWGYKFVVATDGTSALAQLQSEKPPNLVLVDWVMPGMDGLEFCRKARELSPARPLYLILLTARGGRENIVTGLAAGADDFITKPFDPHELRARLRVGFRLVRLQKMLVDRVHELERALHQVKQLQGLLPICSYCKRIRDDRNYWQRVESYISEHSEVQFSHGICPDCFEKVRKKQPVKDSE